MGNSNKGQNNIIHVEFLTAKQKVKKDKALMSQKIDQSENEHLQDIIFIQDLTQYYEVDFRETIYTSDTSIQVKKIVDLVVNSNSKNLANLTKINEFFHQNVKSFQIFFNNQLYVQDEQAYTFNYEPLYIEVIYKPKHWMEKMVAKYKTYSSKVLNALTLVSRFAYLIIPVYTSISALKPFLLPTLKTAKVALKSTQNPKAETASYAIKILIHALQKATIVAAPILALISKYVPGSKALAMGLGVYFGKGVIWNVAKLGITIFCPFLAPLLMLFG